MSGVPKAKIIHNFGWADLADCDGLARLLRSINRFLDPADALAATASFRGGRRRLQAMGACFVADRLWERLGIAEGIAKVAASRRLDGEIVERVIFAMVANHLAVKPLSKLAGCTWMARSAYIDGLAEFSDGACYRAMDFFCSTLSELQETVSSPSPLP